MAIRRPRLVVATTFLTLGTACGPILGLDATTLSLDAGGADATGTGRDAATDAPRDAPAVPPDAATHDSGLPDAREAGIAHDAAPDVHDASAPVFTMTPAVPSVTVGSSAMITVTLARDGYTGAVSTVTLGSLPSGVTCSSGTLAVGVSSVQLTLSATSIASEGLASVTIGGTGVPSSSGSILVAGATGTFDTSFNTSGIVVDSSDGTAGTFYAMVVQADGGIVAAGAKSSDGGWAIRRFMPDGSPDTTFNTNAAMAFTSESLTTGEIHALSLDTMGRILVAGHTGTSAHELAVVRLVTTGAIDNGFGVFRTGGSYFSGSTSQSAGIAALPDGNVVLTAVENPGAGSQPLAYVIGAGGVFKNVLMISTPPQATSFVGVGLGATFLVAAGAVSPTEGQPTAFLTRSATMGGPVDAGGHDAGFNYGYVVTMPCMPLTMALEPNGSTLIAGENAEDDGLCLQHVTAGGVEDWTLSPEYGNFYEYTALAPLESESFYTAEEYGDGNAGYHAVLERHVSTGVVDSSFAANGSMALDYSGTPPPEQSYKYVIHAMAVPGDPTDGRILLAGTQVPMGATAGGYLLLRVWP